MWDLLEPVRYDSTTRHKPQTTFLGETFFLICKAPLLLLLILTMKKISSKRLGSWILVHFLFGVELLLFICFAALLRAFSFVQSHHHLRSAFFGGAEEFVLYLR